LITTMVVVTEVTNHVLLRIRRYNMIEDIVHKAINELIREVDDLKERVARLEDKKVLK